MIVIPEGPGGLVVAVDEVFDHSTKWGPLRADFLVTRGIEEFRIAVELEVAVSTMEVGDDRDPVVSEGEVFVACKAVTPVE
jgi:hypothetical protein